MKLRNPANAFVIIDEGKTKIAVDPWITDGIYEKSWHIYPTIDASIIDELKTITHVLITHIHEDHMDVNALKLLPFTTPIYVPDVYPNRQVTKRKLGALFERIIFVPISTQVTLDNVTFEVIPPMNRFGHLSDTYVSDDPDTVVAIDCGFIVSSVENKVVLLADNFPYNVAASGDSHERMKFADLIAFPYNACADDYPLCYDNYTIDEKRTKALARNVARIEFLKRAFEDLQPKMVMPYSSDFLIAGPRAIEFVDVHPIQFLDKKLLVKEYKEQLGVPMLTLGSKDALGLKSNSFYVKQATTSPQSIHDVAQALYKHESNIEDMYEPATYDQVHALFLQASDNMIKRLKAMNLKSDWTLRLRCKDQPDAPVMVLNLQTGEKSLVTPDQSLTENVLECCTSAKYLKALLSFKSHWDNAIISSNLSWQRNPDKYDVGLWKSLNFFHT